MKKLLSIVMTFVLISTSISVFASDLDSFNIEQAIETLEKLKIIKGYERNYFITNEKVSRGEAFKIAFNLFPPEYEDAGNVQEQELFLDITKNHTSRNAITMFGLLGIVLGDGDGNVRPDDSILTEELVTLLVKTLGYNNSETVKKLGFPVGYMQIANDIGLMKNVSKKAGEFVDGQNFVIMVYNTLKIPKMVFSQYDASTLTPLYKVDETQFFQKDILEYNGIPSRNINLPGRKGNFYYHFGIMNKQYSDFLITPTNIDTGIRLKFQATNKDHTLRFEVIDKDSNKMIYCSEYMTILKDFLQELYLPREYFEENHSYYIKLTYPSFTDAGGFFEISD